MRRILNLSLLLFSLLFPSIAPAADPLPTPSATLNGLDGSVVVSLVASTDAQNAKPFLVCMSRLFPVRYAETTNHTVADYLSRFYGYTDAFHKARRCDSFILRRAESSAEGPGWYHIAVFSYDGSKAVERIRRLEKKGDEFRRTPATDEGPGLLTFKGPSERYRVFFLGRRVVFFFWESSIGSPDDAQPYGEDPKLRDAALRIVNSCLKE